jgi:DNA-binding SARP family transcriptional activator
MLLLEAGRVVSVQRLIAALWDGEPPNTARSQVQICISALRKLLTRSDAGIVTQPPGYLLQIADGSLDLWRFRQLCHTGDSLARQQPEQAVARYRQGLALWRGDACDSVASQVVSRTAIQLNEERWTALERCMTLELGLGRHRQVVAELARFVAAEPLRERPRAQLMLALYRSGRQADALEVYRSGQQLLAEEIGADPGKELKALELAILTSDPALDRGMLTVEPGIRRDEETAEIPRQLPGTLPSFIGRAAELSALTRVLDQSGAFKPGTVVISTVAGTAGVGKTALAIHWAHQVAHRFPDGQLYLNLRGFDPSGNPVTANEAMPGLLGSLGVPDSRLPFDLPTQAALYRTLLASRHMLILLDNVCDEEQIRPLLPGTASCLVVVTSRSQLTGLTTSHGAQVLTLDVLPEADGRAMLIARLGARRVAAEPEAVAEITALCAHLPLGLAITAARADAHPALSLTALAAELANTAGRLDALDTGDPQTSVRAVFSWSVRQLTADAAQMFRLLGLHCGPDISAPAAASLAAVTLTQAREALDELARAHLVTKCLSGRYSCHDLLRAYAADQACITDSEADRQSAAGRIVDHYLQTAHAASVLIDSARLPIAVPPARPGVQPERLADFRHALAWLQAEHQVLPAVIALAESIGSDVQAWQIPWTMLSFLRRRWAAGEGRPAVSTRP